MVRKPKIHITIFEDELEQTLTIFQNMCYLDRLFSTFFNEVFRSYNNSKKSQFR